MHKDLGGDGYCDDVPGVSRGVSAASPEASMLGASEEASLPSAGEDQSYGRLVFAGSRQGRSFRGTRQRYFGGSRGHLSKYIGNIVAVAVTVRVFGHRVIIRVGRRDPSHWLCGVLVHVRTRRGIPSVRTGMWMLCVLIPMRIRCLKTRAGTATVTMFPMCLEGCPRLPPKYRCLVPRKKRLCRLPVKTSRPSTIHGEWRTGLRRQTAGMLLQKHQATNRLGQRRTSLETHRESHRSSRSRPGLQASYPHPCVMAMCCQIWTTMHSTGPR